MSSFIGQITLFAGSLDLEGWQRCDGTLLPENFGGGALFSLIGRTYGGSESDQTFAVPDLRGRVPIQQGTGPGLSPYSRGDNGGVETVTLNTSQIPSHIHAATVKQPVNSGGSNTEDPSGTVPANSGTNSCATTADSAFLSPANTTIESTGGGLSHENRQPYLALDYFINTSGVYPSHK